MKISRWEYFLLFRWVPLGFGGIVLFSSIGNCIYEGKYLPVGAYLGGAVGFLLGTWLACKGMPPE